MGRDYSDEELREMNVKEAKELEGEDLERYNELKSEKTEKYLEEKQLEDEETRREGAMAFLDELDEESKIKRVELGDGFIDIDTDVPIGLIKKANRIQKRFKKMEDLKVEDNVGKVNDLIDEVLDVLDRLIDNMDKEMLEEHFVPDDLSKAKGTKALEKLFDIVFKEINKVRESEKKRSRT